MITYKASPPSLEEFSEMLQDAEWAGPPSFTDKDISAAISNSWFWATAYDGDRIVGMGRLISDGHLYAFVCNMMVRAEYRCHGIGSSILTMLKQHCKERNIARVSLFSSPGKTAFYLENGFHIRPDNAPGMQYNTNE